MLYSSYILHQKSVSSALFSLSYRSVGAHVENPLLNFTTSRILTPKLISIAKRLLPRDIVYTMTLQINLGINGTLHH